MHKYFGKLSDKVFFKARKKERNFQIFNFHLVPFCTIIAVDRTVK